MTLNSHSLPFEAPANRWPGSPAGADELAAAGPGQRFDIHLGFLGQAVQVELDGRVGTEQLDAVEAGLEIAARHSPLDTTILLARVDHMDPFALGLICGYARRNCEAGGQTRLVGAQGRVEQRIERAIARGHLLADYRPIR